MEENTEASPSTDPVDGNLPEADQENLSDTHKMDDEEVNTDVGNELTNTNKEDLSDTHKMDDEEVNTDVGNELTNTNKEDLPQEITNGDDQRTDSVKSIVVDEGKAPVEPGLKLDGIEGKEDPEVKPAELELLSQHKPSVPCDEEIEDPTKHFYEDSLYGGDNEQEQIQGIISPEYQAYDRESLLQQYKESLDERSKSQHQNQQFQHKLAEYFKKKKTDDRVQEIEKNVNDQEQRYMKYMSNLEELQKVEERQGASIEIQLEEMHRKCTEMENKVEDASNEFVKFKYEVAADAINSRSGKHIPAKDLEQYRSFEAKKEQEVIAVRLENIKLKNRLKKREQQLKAKEELAEGLHLIDFEQLKIENQTYHEKIEERNEELLKLRKKITNTVQELTHLKEKLQFVQGENGEQRSKLRDIEVTVAQKRDILTRLKQVRDALRIDNNKLKHKAGLLGNKPLLRDYEIRKDEADELRTQLEALKNQHVDLNLALQGVKKKIEKSKPVHSL